ncbi:MAG: 6-phosphofructokinase [Clostridiales Family XIII bacterium]|jgi:6-phosphofructokinase 1|nr:6-phosphofructokinase [Clostridiales Family XIII bacterium]
MAKKNMIIAQSGGPSSAINASICGAISRAIAADEIGHVFGAVNGMQGLLDRKIICIDEQMIKTEDFDMLIHTPAQALGSSRYKIPQGPDGDAVFEQILEILREYNIGYFFYNGGNDSMDTVNRVANFLKEKNIDDIVAVGIPKTIDNDLMFTDHTPGFGSAARYVATSIAELELDSGVYPNPGVTIVEIMGRNAGWLTAASVLAKDSGSTAPDLIYLPEVAFSKDKFIEQLGAKLEEKKHVLVAVSEGIRDKDGVYLADTGAAVDMFGHKTLGGVATELEKLIKEKLPIDKLKIRPVQFSTLQRAGAHLASDTDLKESFQCGFRAVEAGIAGKTAIMITINRTSDEPYLVKYDEAPLNNIANAEKEVPAEWITEDGAGVTQDMVTYLRPLVSGEASEKFVAGLPQFFRFDWTKIINPADYK